MKIFLDTANVEDIKKRAATGLINGVTTNPSLLSKKGGDPRKVIAQITSILANGEISVEITEKDPEAVYKQAKEIAQLGNNILVKIPCHKDYYAVIKRLVDEGVPLNITLVFTLIQGLMMCKLGARYISPFVGRWDDIDVEGVEVLSKLRAMINGYGFKTQILAASIRHVRHFHYAILAGANVVTVPINVLEKATTHVLTDQGIEKFDADWQKLGIKQFP